jgi:hypothetical protein
MSSKCSDVPDALYIFRQPDVTKPCSDSVFTLRGEQVESYERTAVDISGYNETSKCCMIPRIMNGKQIEVDSELLLQLDWETLLTSKDAVSFLGHLDRIDWVGELRHSTPKEQVHMVDKFILSKHSDIWSIFQDVLGDSFNDLTTSHPKIINMISDPSKDEGYRYMVDEAILYNCGEYFHTYDPVIQSSILRTTKFPLLLNEILAHNISEFGEEYSDQIRNEVIETSSEMSIFFPPLT